jgi:NADH-quinone oxidoreductase subunit C
MPDDIKGQGSPTSPPASAGNPAASGPPAPKPAPPPAAAKPAGPAPVAWQSEMVDRLKARFGSGIAEAVAYLGQNYLTVERSILLDILLELRDAEQFDYLVDLTAVHYPQRPLPFEVLYILYSFPRNERIRVKAQLPEGEAMPTAVSIWSTANWLERECFDMFGIRFDGHPGLKRILLPEGWKGYPLRKDYGIIQQDQEWVQINLGIESGQ